MKRLAALCFVVIMQGAGPAVSNDDPIAIRFHGLEGLNELASDNPLIAQILHGHSPDRSMFASDLTIFLEAKAKEKKPGFAIKYENEECHLSLPPSRYLTFDFTAGRISLVTMFLPSDMLTLEDAIKLGKTMGDDFARAGCLQRLGADRNLTEESILNKGGEPSSIISDWRMCGSTIVSGLIKVRYYGNQYVGTSVPLGALKNPFHDRKEHYLVELDISVDSPFDEELMRAGYAINEKVTGKRFDPPPLSEWLEHPEWYGRGP